MTSEIVFSSRARLCAVIMAMALFTAGFAAFGAEPAAASTCVTNAYAPVTTSNTNIQGRGTAGCSNQMGKTVKSELQRWTGSAWSTVVSATDSSFCCMADATAAAYCSPTGSYRTKVTGTFNFAGGVQANQVISGTVWHVAWSGC